MKKIILVLTLIFITGCTDLSNTPIKKTEEYLKKYQTLDNAVIIDLNNVVDDNLILSKNQKKEYIDIMKKHYQNITYKIKEDKIDGNEAKVTVEIEVTNLKKVLDEVNLYLQKNPDEFNDDFGNYNTTKYNDYKLQKMKDAKEKIKYTIEIDLVKVDDEWHIGKVEQETLDKINGVYNY